MRGLIEQRVEPAALLANSDDVGVLERYQCALSKVRSVDQRMRLGMRVSAFTSCGRAVAHVRGGSGPLADLSNSADRQPEIFFRMLLICFWRWHRAMARCEVARHEPGGSLARTFH